jgi:hypothetical protein
MLPGGLSFAGFVFREGFAGSLLGLLSLKDRVMFPRASAGIDHST